jgi:hypothetical protein
MREIAARGFTADITSPTNAANEGRLRKIATRLRRGDAAMARQNCGQRSDAPGLRRFR